MNQKRQRFVEAFIGEARGNATQAAILAGYSKNGAGQTAHILLKDTEIAAAIEARQQALVARSSMTAERIIEELSAVAEAKVDVKSSDKLKALELLGKHRKMWDDQKDQTSKITVNIGYLNTTHEPLTIDVHALETHARTLTQK